jgi:EAL and modified HD-GYP domain-containing signal transduction protein
MQDHPVLGQVALGYVPVVDAQRQIVCTRLSVLPTRADAPPELSDLAAALDEVWPASAAPGLSLSLKGESTAAGGRPGAAAPWPPLWLHLASETSLAAALRDPARGQWLLEVPAFLAADPAWTEALLARRAEGAALAVSGRLLAPLAPEVAACFSHCVAESRAEGLAGAVRVHPRVRRSDAMQAAFDGGAQAVVGWPQDDEVTASSVRRTPPPDVQAVMALIDGVNREAPVGQLEPLLKRDPTLAFRLMRYLNSPAFGLSVEINSLGHALMLLGYQRLKRWLAVLLASSSKGVNAKALMYVAVRRGLILEELVRAQKDSELSGEMFLCGVFSLLDKLLGQPLPELLANVPVPERVQQALIGATGPHRPYLELVQALEADALFEIRERSEALMLSLGEVNRALLAALKSARQLD